MSAITRTAKPPTVYSGAVDRVVVGHRLLKNIIERALKDLPFNVQLFPPVSFKDRDYHEFCRDTQVVLLDRTLLIPYPLLFKMLAEKFLAMLPLGSVHWLYSDNSSSYSDGFCKKRVGVTVDYAETRGLPYRRGRSVIEGGNCFVFKSPEGISKAIIGSHALLLSYLGLCSQNYFKLNKDEWDRLKNDIATPSDQSVLQVRNYNHYMQYRNAFAQRIEDLVEMNLDVETYNKSKNQIDKEFAASVPGGINGYINMLLSPITDEDREFYRGVAIEHDAAMAMTIDVIAKDLQVEKHNLAIVDQSFFHLDMFMFVGPKGDRVYIHDEYRSRDALDRLIYPGSITGKELTTLENYRKASEERSRKIDMSRPVQQLESIGLTVVKVPGLFEAPGEKSLNFLNGLLLGNVFLTGGSLIKRLERIFASALKLNTPHPFDVRFLDAEERRGFMAQFATTYFASVHCLTMVHPMPRIVTSFDPKGRKLTPELQLWELTRLGELEQIILAYLDPFSTSSCSEEGTAKRLTQELIKNM